MYKGVFDLHTCFVNNYFIKKLGEKENKRDIPETEPGTKPLFAESVEVLELQLLIGSYPTVSKIIKYKYIVWLLLSLWIYFLYKGFHE